MHNWAKEIMECVKTKVNGKGLDNIEGKDLEEFKMWACIAKEIAEYDYYYHVTEAMKESEYGEDYDENGRKGYRQPRDSRGRYTRRGYEGRGYEGRGYEGRGYESMDYENRGYSQSGRGYEDAENMRDMDRDTQGKMYYFNTDARGYSSNSGSSNRGYEEVKDAESLNKLLDELEDDMRTAKSKMNQQDINSAKQRLASLSNMMM